ncbi:hypothetical protein BD413DRAFT_488905 [Trametes elegans]|nr:hypothetical protein BD413DRAFT_488905 [Trametes elegans]
MRTTRFVQELLGLSSQAEMPPHSSTMKPGQHVFRVELANRSPACGNRRQHTQGPPPPLATYSSVQWQILRGTVDNDAQRQWQAMKLAASALLLAKISGMEMNNFSPTDVGLLIRFLWEDLEFEKQEIEAHRLLGEAMKHALERAPTQGPAVYRATIQGDAPSDALVPTGNPATDRGPPPAKRARRT